MKKARLALDQLEKELALIPKMELSKILGGNGSGSSGYVPGSSGYNPGSSGYNPGYGGSGNSGYSSGGSGSQGLDPDASLDEVMGYLFGQGVPMTTSSGSYYFMGGSGAFVLDEVTIYGGSSGSGSTGVEWYNSYFSGFSSGSTLDIYISILRANGFTFTSDGAGGYTYTAPPAEQPLNPTFSSADFEWLRNELTGKIVTRPTGRTSPDNLHSLSYSNDETLYWEEVWITHNGLDVLAYELVKVTDHEGNLKTIEERHRSNCHGYAMTGGEFWIMDSDIASTGNEAKPIEDHFQDDRYFEVVTKEEAEYATIWAKATGTSGLGELMHSGRMDSNGKYIHKSDHQALNSSTTEAEFKNGHWQDDSNIDSTIVYYKRRQPY